MRPFDRAPLRLARLVTPLLLAGAMVLPAAPAVAAAEPNFPASMSGYHNWPEMVGAIKQAAIDYPAIVSVFSIGRSYQGRYIWMAKVSDNVATDEGEPEVLVDALHHAREHLSTEQALALLRWLTTGYGGDPNITRLVNGREIFIVFALNPDGMRYDLTGSPFRAWRKNRQLDSAGRAMYTDLNRNYEYQWGCCGGSSSSRSSITYRGPRAFSAPETQALRDFVASRVIGGVQQIRTHVTLHTNGRLILWPYGYTRRDVPATMTSLDHSTFVSLGRAMAARNGYKAEQSSDLYITDGDQIDWLYARHRIFTYTFELYPPETATVRGDHYPDDSKIAAQTARNRSALLLLIDRAACPYATLGAAYTKADCGPLYDDLEINRRWVRNPLGTDTATSGLWGVGDPQPTSSSGAKQLGTTVSGARALVTGTLTGTSAGANDVDGGSTTMKGRPVTLPADPAAVGRLTFRYVFAHGAGSTPDDAFRVMVEDADGTRTTVFERLGTPADVDGTWASANVDVSAWAGKTIALVVEAVDGAADSLVEAEVDDIRIRQP